MHTRYINASERASRNKRMNILTDLIALRNVRIEITFTIKLRKIRNGPVDRGTDTQNVFDGIAIHNRQSSRMRHTDRTYVYVRSRLVRIVRAVTEHFRSRMELCVNLQTDSRTVHTERVP